MRTTKSEAASATRATWTMLAAACLTLLASTTQATEAGSPAPQKLVTYGDLNLGNTKAVSELYGRIKSAATLVCGGVGNNNELARAAAARPCIEKSMVEAITTVNSPMLTSLYLAKAGRTGQQFATVALLR
jgi:UrcA family protein